MRTELARKPLAWGRRLTALASGDRLLARMLRGSVVLGAGGGAEQAMRLVRNMVLARILLPEALGIMAIVLTVSSIFLVLTGMGIREAVIQDPQSEEKPYLNGAWWLASVRGIILLVLGLFLAPHIAAFYEDARLTSLLRLAFLAPLFDGLISPRAYITQKQMKYLRWALISQGGAAIGITTAIVLAYVLRSAQALVIGFVTEAVARCILSFVLCPFRPGWDFDRERLRDLFRYTRGILGLPALTLIYGQAGTFVAAKLCSKHELGLYAMALSLSQMPTMLGTVFLKPLLLPAFSELQHQTERLNRAFLRVSLIVLSVLAPAVLFGVLHSREILMVVYGQQYAGAALALSLMLINAALATANIVVVSVYLGTGKPALLRRFGIIRAVALALIIYPLVRRAGIVGAAAGPLVAMCIGYGFQVARLQSLCDLSAGAYLLTAAKAACFGLPVAIAWLATRHGADAQPLVSLSVSAAAALSVYALAGLILWRAGKLKSLVRSQFS